MARKIIIATATSTRCYSPAEVELVEVKTVRRGEKVVRYQWVDCGFAGSFGSIESAISAANNHACLSNVRLAA